MKRFALCSITLLGFYFIASAQSPQLLSFNEQRLKINRQGMLVLGAWGLGNLIAGGVGAASTNGRQRYFWGMNAGWGGINALIAGFSYKAALADPASFALSKTVAEQGFINQFLLFNAGLDAAYMVTGLYLKERARRFESGQDNHNRLTGFGDALLLQGGFLMLFDFTMFFIHKSHSKALYQLLEQVSVTSQGIGWVWRF
ncbi:MAG: hypothetical protein AAGA85_07335 [Bacteroidota bacterium]